jgi:hypothetical protein
MIIESQCELKSLKEIMCFILDDIVYNKLLAISVIVENKIKLTEFNHTFLKEFY